ncbi:hypothetical protein K490DRAFT_61333 [Saccharata proteae CBS 121410]|uniref:Uncharacterized protein n=1 Tax=Saccharata proteae CBS 121410 TaxID=1314787 RepID=A0A9P4I2B8_9PEZI|nr:hypothetical protein K490DRAFT_61333 [Saccharata proteae CBS 121410]
MPPQDAPHPPHERNSDDDFVRRLREQSSLGVRHTLADLQHAIDTASIIRLTDIAFDSGVKCGARTDPTSAVQRLREAHEAARQAYVRAQQLQLSNQNARVTISRFYNENEALRKENERLVEMINRKVPEPQAITQPYKNIRVKVAPPPADDMQDLIDFSEPEDNDRMRWDRASNESDSKVQIPATPTMEEQAPRDVNPGVFDKFESGEHVQTIAQTGYLKDLEESTDKAATAVKTDRPLGY